MYLDKTITPEANMLKLLNKMSHGHLVAADFAMPTPETVPVVAPNTSNTQLTLRMNNALFPGLTKVRYTRLGFPQLFPDLAAQEILITNSTTYAELLSQIRALFWVPSAEYAITGLVPVGQQTAFFTITPVVGHLLYLPNSVTVKVRNTSVETRSMFVEVSTLENNSILIPNRITGTNATRSGTGTVSNAVQRLGRNTIACLSTNYFTWPAAESHDLRTGDFTVEFWFYTTAAPGNYIFMGQIATGGTTRVWALQLLSNLVYCYFGPASASALGTGNVPHTSIQNQWAHLAFTRKGNVFSVWFNGQRVFTTTIASFPVSVTPTTVNIGHNPVSGAGKWTGYVDDFKIDRVCKYDSAFTPS